MGHPSALSHEFSRLPIQLSPTQKSVRQVNAKDGMLDTYVLPPGRCTGFLFESYYIYQDLIRRRSDSLPFETKPWNAARLSGSSLPFQNDDRQTRASTLTYSRLATDNNTGMLEDYYRWILFFRIYCVETILMRGTHTHVRCHVLHSPKQRSDDLGNGVVKVTSTLATNCY